MKTQILLADDHQVVLDGLRALLAGEDDLDVVGEATDGLQVLPKVLQLKPAVVVVDLMMPGLNGLEVVRQVKQRAPETRVIVLSMHANDAYVVEALRNGASGYVLKQAEAHALVDAIRAVRGGGRYLSPPLTDDKLERWQREAQAAPLDLYDTLSTREREVLQLAAEGLTSAAIGERLQIGKRTVETHRANLQRKLGLKSQAELVRLAVKKGLVSVD
ncbi:MAG TPA: response regulator transcription factor [Polyangia bacterium]|jgi:DNA-binding NarL/FixJ family response regulator|nr:response regulator transcription factor [Polyangia bacterium]